MKRLWISLAALALIFCATLWNTARVTAVTDSISSKLEEAESAVTQGDWRRATVLTESAQQEWERVDRYFSVVLRHADTDDVTTTFQEVQGFLQWEAEAEYTSVNSALVEKVKHLSEVETLTWNNLL